MSRGAGRYAPSPSGTLHLGNLRTAVVAWLAARTTGRRFLLRFDDLDRARDAGTAPAQQADLASLGIDWDEDPVFQTTRLGAYESALQFLREQEMLYPCFCTRKDVLTAPSAPHAPPGSYPGTCRNLSADEQSAARQAIAPRQPSIRIRMPDPYATVTFVDRLHGPTIGKIDDVVVVRGDGTFAYHLATVVDDDWSGVDQVVRGDDLLASTGRQIALQRILGLRQPEYVHVPLVLGPAGKRLAKRDGAVTLHDLHCQGVPSSEVFAWIAKSLGLGDTESQLTLQSLVSTFRIDDLPRTPVTYLGREFRV